MKLRHIAKVKRKLGKQLKKPRTRVTSGKRMAPQSKPSTFEFAASVKLLQTFFELSADAVFVARKSRAIDYANPAASAMFGYSLDEFIALGGPRSVRTVDPRYDSFRKERSRLGRAFSEMRLIRRDGTEFEAEVSSAIVDDEDGRMQSIVIFRDISRRKKAEQGKNHLVGQLRELTRQQHRAREEERTAVAREIHDEFGQVLTGLRIDLSLLARRLLPEQEDLAVKIESMQKLIRDTTKNVQRLATELRPGVLDELGLVAAVEWQLQQVSERTGLTYEFDVDDDEMEIERDTATALFRILQEALTNVVRHSDATQVSVKLEEQSDQLLLVIKDNGRGIDKSQISDSFALGLLGMRERAGALGGDLSVEGTMGMGTTIVAHIPRAAFLEEEL